MFDSRYAVGQKVAIRREKRESGFHGNCGSLKAVPRGRSDGALIGGAAVEQPGFRFLTGYSYWTNG
ncbi:MAG TPA: hypothetical protein DD732_10235 [Rhizobiales bacterium]|nr:hypothetical protein [Hyphomicrobiales bacterium]